MKKYLLIVVFRNKNYIEWRKFINGYYDEKERFFKIKNWKNHFKVQFDNEEIRIYLLKNKFKLKLNYIVWKKNNDNE